VRQDEHRHPEGRRVAARLETDVEHPLPDQDRPGRGILLIHDRGVGLRLRTEHPVVKPIPIVSHPISDAHVRSGDEPVKRHRDLGRDLAHQPAPAQLVAEYDPQMMDQAAPFSTADFEEDEREGSRKDRNSSPPRTLRLPVLADLPCALVLVSLLLLANISFWLSATQFSIGSTTRSRTWRRCTGSVTSPTSCSSTSGGATSVLTVRLMECVTGVPSAQLSTDP
jgi:hypothetical protein